MSHFHVCVFPCLCVWACHVFIVLRTSFQQDINFCQHIGKTFVKYKQLGPPHHYNVQMRLNVSVLKWVRASNDDENDDDSRGWTLHSRYVHILFDQSLCKCNTYMANTNLHSFSTRQKSFQMGLNSMLLLFIYSCIVFRLSHTLCIASCPFVHLHLLFPGLSFFSCLICSSICFCLVRFFSILLYFSLVFYLVRCLLFLFLFLLH